MDSVRSVGDQPPRASLAGSESGQAVPEGSGFDRQELNDTDHAFGDVVGIRSGVESAVRLLSGCGPGNEDLKLLAERRPFVLHLPNVEH